MNKSRKSIHDSINADQAMTPEQKDAFRNMLEEMGINQSAEVKPA